MESVYPQAMDVAEMLSTKHNTEKKHNRMMLLLIIMIKFLGCQGLALRGDNDESNGNFIQIEILKTVGNEEEVCK